MATSVVEPTTRLGAGPRTIATEASLRARTSRFHLPGPFSGGRARYFLRRVGAYLVVAWAAVTLNFVIPRFMPGDPAEAVLRRIQFDTGRVASQSVESPGSATSVCDASTSQGPSAPSSCPDRCWSAAPTP